MQGFGEGFKLCASGRAYHQMGNAVAPPVVATVAAVMLESCGFEVPVEFASLSDAGSLESAGSGGGGVDGGGVAAPIADGGRAGVGAGARWGWAVAKALLLSSSPDDERRAELAEILESASSGRLA